MHARVVLGVEKVSWLELYAYTLYITMVVNVNVQWNRSNPDTNGAEEVSLLLRCPHFRG